MYIATKSFVKDFIAYGTIGYLRTANNEVRQCVCLGGHSIPSLQQQGRHEMEYEWKVAGFNEHFTTRSVSRLSIGIIYDSESAAKRGTYRADVPAQIGELKTNLKVNLYEILNSKYGLSRNCVKLGGTWDDLFSLHCYGVCTDNSVKTFSTDFEIFVIEDGVEIIVPHLDKNLRYPTKEQAYNAMAPCKTYLLVDEYEKETPTIKKITITIEVEETNLEEVKKYATILKKC